MPQGISALFDQFRSALAALALYDLRVAQRFAALCRAALLLGINAI